MDKSRDDNGTEERFDPTKNVLDLVRAESKYQDAQRESLVTRLLDLTTSLKEQFKILSDGMSMFQNSQRIAETNRIDQLAETRQEFQNTIRDMLAESVRTTSTLVSTQLVQIQATFDTRVSKLEAYQFTQAGKSSVSDPLTSDAMTRVTRDLMELRASQESAAAKMQASISSVQLAENRSGAQMTGRESTNARMISISMAIAAGVSSIMAIVIAFMALRGHTIP